MMAMPVALNFNQTKALARFMTTLRGDWDVDGCITFVAKIAHVGAEEAARVVARYALDAHNRTPAALPMAGPHWGPSPAGTTAPRAVHGPTCGICGQVEEVCRARHSKEDHVFETVEQMRARAAGPRPRPEPTAPDPGRLEGRRPSP